MERRQALVVVHLSSLDSYTYTDYEAEGDYSKGEALGLNLTEAILNHEGPVYIVDQGWEPDRRESRPRAALLEQIVERDDIRWIHFDEADEEWDDFEREIVAALRKDRVTSVVVGGVWYDPEQKEGCATETYFRLKKHFKNTRVDKDLVGCESDFEWTG